MGAPKVVGIAEIAARLGVGRSYARELALRKGFPEPTRLKMGLVWDAGEVEAWIRKNRPPKPEG